MVIKILKNTANGFPGVAYSENKNEKGTGDLMVAQNFDGLDNSNSGSELFSSKNDYVNYLEFVSKLNSKVKVKQFHAVVSSKGKESSFEQLKDAAIKYLDHMGYGNNPYLIYKHNDTENNHVHIVSTRVDKQGKKISDKYEKFRTQNFIKNELKIDHSKTYHKANFTKYQFSTHAQFKLLLEQQNYKVIDKKDHYVIYSGRIEKDKIIKSEIDALINNRKPEINNITQIKALFHKFKPGMSTSSFTSEMRKKFGYEIVFHHAKNKDPKIPTPLYDKPYGYTLIDHNNKQVYKGSEIQPISFVLNELNEKEHREMLVYFLKQEFDNRKLSLYELNKSLKGLDYNANYRGVINSKALDKDIFSIDPERLKTLLYYNKVHLINGYSANNEIAAAVLKSYYKIDNSDFKVEPNVSIEKQQYYDQMMEQHFFNKQFSKESLEKKQLKIIGYQDQFFLIDLKNKAIIAIPEVYNKTISSELVEQLSIAGEREMQNGPQQEHLQNAISQYQDLNLIPNLGDAGDDDDDQLARRKRKKRNNSQNLER